MNDVNKDDAWLARPSSIKLLWRIFWAVLVATVLLQLVFKVKGYFGFDDWVGFGAIYGFLCCVAMVLVAKGLGLFLKREQNYYREDDQDD